MQKNIVVTGGAGFIGSYLVRKLVGLGHNVVVVDNLLRGMQSRIDDVLEHVTLCTGDIRDETAMAQAFKGADVVYHLAAVNGTENFYKRPELVLDVGIRGAISVMNACRQVGVPEIVVASTAEVYQTPTVVPTDETIPLMLPDSLNPRYSYGGSKILTELVAFNYGIGCFDKVQVFRPHNIYGADMGWKHVIPQFIIRALEGMDKHGTQVPFEIFGTGQETRAFCHVSDVVDGIVLMQEKGEDRSIYHIGNDYEISMLDLANTIVGQLGITLEFDHLTAHEGATPRRCPDIGKMRALGYMPSVTLEQGIQGCIEWYAHNRMPPENNTLV